MAEPSVPLPPSPIAQAARWATTAGVLAWSAAALGVAAALGAQFAPSLVAPPDAKSDDLAQALLASGNGVRALCAVTAGGAACAAAGLFPTWLLLRARVRVADATDTARLAAQQRAARLAAVAAGNEAAPGQQLFSAEVVPQAVVTAELERLRRLAGWPQALAAGVPALAAIAAAWCWWPRGGGDAGAFALGIAAIVLGFPALVCERRFAHAASAALPEAPALARLLRLLLWALVGGGVCALARALGLGAALWGQWALAALIAAVSAELALRALAAPFLPTAVGAGVALPGGRALGDSLVAALAMPRGDAGHGLGGGLKERFGIDLSQSWALGFVRRAAGPLLIALLAAAWLLSGVTVLDTTERGVYERLGAPAAVLPPGLHLHLPYPFGIVRRVEHGPVHELAIALDDGIAVQTQTLPSTDAEASADYDRLWDREHPSEAFYVVPAPGIGDRERADAGAQSCQVLNSDVRVFYRIGLDDAAAFAALYHVTSPTTAVRVAAGRLLVDQFAARTLFQVIGADRDALSAAFRAALQRELDALGSGLEITAVAIDSIHPPTRAAASYHGVQAAEISARTEIASARSDAAKLIAEAEAEAVVTRDQGASSAADLTSKARSDAIRFDAEVGAFAKARQALIQERWLRALGSGLSRGQLTIIDHRLQITEGPVIDLRRFSPPTDKTR